MTILQKLEASAKETKTKLAKTPSTSYYYYELARELKRTENLINHIKNN